MRNAYSASWEQLACESREGKQTAYHYLVRKLRPRLAKFVSKRVKNPQVQEECVQEIFLRIHVSLGNYDCHQSFINWAFVIARRTVADYLRKFYKDVVEVDSQMVERSLSNPQDPIDRISLQRKLAQLPADAEQLILALKVEGKSVQELANQLSISPGAARVRAHRAYQYLVAS